MFDYDKAAYSTNLAFSLVGAKALKNPKFWEHFFLPSLGLNNENLNEQPPELHAYMGHGLGLRIWQYPNQFSRYITFLASFAPQIKTYLEIGCRHGGTYLVHSELLSSLNKNFEKSIAIDIISEPPLISAYLRLNPELAEFIQINSHTDEFAQFLSNKIFDVVFIDGDHSYLGVKNDAEKTLMCSNIQIFHDISSFACPAVGQYWTEFKEQNSETHTFHEFTDQYVSVGQHFLGIGVAVRKAWIE
jgi:hypothetical protein